MIFNEYILALESADDEFNKTFERFKAYSKASYDEYQNNLKEANMKVIEESGTPDDLIYLENQASEGFLVRSAKTIEKMISTFIEWLKKKIETVKEFFTSKKVKDTLDKAEKISKENPKFKNKEVEIPDLEAIHKEQQKIKDKINKKRAEYKSGKRNIDKDLDDIDEELIKVEKTKKAITVTVGVGTALAMLGIFYKDFIKTGDTKVEPVINEDEVLEMDPYDVDAAMHLTRTQLDQLKFESSAMANAMNEVVAALRTAITGEGRLDLDDVTSIPDDLAKKEAKRAMKESVEESTNMDAVSMEQYLDNLFAEVDSKISEATEDIEINDESTVETQESAIENYLNEINKEIDAKEILESVEAEILAESSDDENNPEVKAQMLLESVEAEIEKETSDNRIMEILESVESSISESKEVDETPKEDTLNVKSYLESLETELFNEEDNEPVEESADARLDKMLDDILSSLS
jgi:hypothetical protein